MLVRSAGGKVQGTDDMKKSLSDLNDRIAAVLKERDPARPSPQYQVRQHHFAWWSAFKCISMFIQLHINANASSINYISSCTHRTILKFSDVYVNV